MGLPAREGAMEYTRGFAARIEVQEAGRQFLMRTYIWMLAGLGLTGVVSMYIPANVVRTLLSSSLLYIGLWIGSLLLVGVLSGLVHRMSTPTAALVFFIYAGVMGLLLAPIHYMYPAAVVSRVFLIAAGMFGATSIYGAVTKRDLTGLGHFAMMGLFGLIIAIIVNLFLGSTMMTWVISVLGVIIFTALTAYDTQMIVQMGQEGETSNQMAITGALALYLDFINIFLFLLNLLGRE
jgi:hypothetical protein